MPILMKIISISLIQFKRFGKKKKEEMVNDDAEEDDN